MIPPEKIVTIHPYFKVHPGKLEAFRGLMNEFIAKTATESGNLHYDFTLSGDVVFCRESYAGAEALLVHAASVGPIVERALQIADLQSVEVHGAAEEIEKLRGPLAGLKPIWFVWQCGVRR